MSLNNQGSEESEGSRRGKAANLTNVDTGCLVSSQPQPLALRLAWGKRGYWRNKCLRTCHLRKSLINLQSLNFLPQLCYLAWNITVLPKPPRYRGTEAHRGLDPLFLTSHRSSLAVVCSLNSLESISVRCL